MRRHSMLAAALAALEEAGPLSGAELARAIGVTQHQVSNNMLAWRKRGAIVREGDYPRFMYRAGTPPRAEERTKELTHAVAAQAAHGRSVERLFALVGDVERLVQAYAAELGPDGAPLELSLVLALSAGSAKMRRWHLGVPEAELCKGLSTMVGIEGR